MPLLARLTHAKRPLALIAPPHLPYAPALRQHGVALSKLTVVDTANDHDALWASEELLRARAGAVLLWHETIDTIAQRRLQLARSEEHTSELQSLMRISYAVFCLNKKNKQ